MAFLHVVSREKDPYDRGFALGTQIKDLVKSNLHVYMKSFLHYGLSRSSVIRIARGFKPIFEKYDQNMLYEMKGLADSASLKLEEVLALNVRYELIWGSRAGCTSIAIQPEASKDAHTLIGQNWDWLVSVGDSCHTWRIVESGKPDIICFTEGGILGPKVGMNSAGLSLAISGLVSGKDGIRKGVPFHLICRKILESSSMNEPLEFIERIPRAGSANYLIAHKEGEILNVETSPDQVGYLYPQNRMLVHTNHFLALKVDDVGRRRYPDSVIRYFRCQRLLSQQRDGFTSDDIQRILSDHFNFPNSICFHSSESGPSEEREQTNASVVLDLNNHSLRIAKGNPCKNQFEQISIRE